MSPLLDFMTLGQAHALIAARVPEARLVGAAALGLMRVHTDTRTLQAGDLFVALRGERFDAHDFLPQARAAGAVAAIAERGLAEAGLAGIEVPDALQALQALAAGWCAPAWPRSARRPSWRSRTWSCGSGRRRPARPAPGRSRPGR